VRTEFRNRSRTCEGIRLWAARMRATKGEQREKWRIPQPITTDGRFAHVIMTWTAPDWHKQLCDSVRWRHSVLHRTLKTKKGWCWELVEMCRTVEQKNWTTCKGGVCDVQFHETGMPVVKKTQFSLCFRNQEKLSNEQIKWHNEKNCQNQDAFFLSPKWGRKMCNWSQDAVQHEIDNSRSSNCPCCWLKKHKKVRSRHKLKQFRKNKKRHVLSVDESNKLTQQEASKPNSRSVVTVTMEVRARQDLKGSRKIKNATRLAGFFAQRSQMATPLFQLTNQTNGHKKRLWRQIQGMSSLRPLIWGHNKTWGGLKKCKTSPVLSDSLHNNPGWQQHCFGWQMNQIDTTRGCKAKF